MNEHLGETGTEQFGVRTFVDGALNHEQPIHDPFIRTKIVTGIGRLDLFKAMFRKQFSITIEVWVDGSEGASRAIMCLNPHELQRETEEILEARRQSRERHARGDYSSDICASPA